jgi:DNA-directed RNA polymerase specialized sigma24 family protein
MARLRRVMPTRLARMALMRSFDGMKLQEIGDVFGTSDSYVSKLLEPVREYVVSAIESECA